MEPKDVKFEGKEEWFMDIDRMTNEGLAGGHVGPDYHNGEIDTATEIQKESPPKTTD